MNARLVMTEFALSLMLCVPHSVYASPLLIAVEDAAEQWSNKDGTGFANDVVIEAFKTVGVGVKLKVVPYARCKIMLIDGDVAACFSMSREQGLNKTVKFSERPLFIVYVDYFQNPKKPLKVKRERELPKGTTIGIVTGYEYPETTMKLREKGIVFQEARDEETNLRKLAEGRIDAAIINQNDTKPARAMIDKAGLKGLVEFAFRSKKMGSFIGFSKVTPQGGFARREFNKGFEIIRSNGTLRRITYRWKSKSGIIADK